MTRRRPKARPLGDPMQDVLSDPLAAQLSPEEQSEYARLSAFFRLTDERNKRNEGVTAFIKHLRMIHSFVVRDDGNDALRGLVCGIIFSNPVLVVNTDRLKKFTCRSKSCVNGCFQKLGFDVSRATQELNTFFQSILPAAVPDLSNPRHWCIRKATDESSLSFLSRPQPIPSEPRQPEPAADPAPSISGDPQFLLDLSSLLNLAHPLGSNAHTYPIRKSAL